MLVLVGEVGGEGRVLGEVSQHPTLADGATGMCTPGRPRLPTSWLSLALGSKKCFSLRMAGKDEKSPKSFPCTRRVVLRASSWFGA